MTGIPDAGSTIYSLLTIKGGDFDIPSVYMTAADIYF